jgi:hypothetical protein
VTELTFHVAIRTRRTVPAPPTAVPHPTGSSVEIPSKVLAQGAGSEKQLTATASSLNAGDRRGGTRRLQNTRRACSWSSRHV